MMSKSSISLKQLWRSYGVECGLWSVYYHYFVKNLMLPLH